jgi:hypothetical protein
MRDPAAFVLRCEEAPDVSSRARSVPAVSTLPTRNEDQFPDSWTFAHEFRNKIVSLGKPHFRT